MAVAFEYEADSIQYEVNYPIQIQNIEIRVQV